MTQINKIILIGSTGMLGRYIYKYFTTICKTYNVITINSDRYRISQESLSVLERILLDAGLDDRACVINCAGAIPQRNSNGAEANYYIVNAIFPHVLWSICQRHGAKMIHPTTDCVYNGSRGAYKESDIADESGAYGLSKALGEPATATVIRTSIIGKELRNKKSFMEWILGAEGNVNGWTNHLWNGITCLQWCKVVEQILERDLWWQGTRHILSPVPYSKYEMAKTIRDIFELDLIVNPVVADKTVDKTLASEYPEIFDIPDLRQQIEELKDFDLD